MSRYDPEIEQLKAGVNCAALLEKLGGYKLDEQESSRKSLKYRRGAGEIIIVNHDGKGWWDAGGSAKGGQQLDVHRIALLVTAATLNATEPERNSNILLSLTYFPVGCCFTNLARLKDRCAALPSLRPHRTWPAVRWPTRPTSAASWSYFSGAGRRPPLTRPNGGTREEESGPPRPVTVGRAP